MRVDGRLVLNGHEIYLDAVLGGHGLAFMIEDRVRDYLETGQLVSVLNDWCQPFPGFHLYYPSRNQMSPVLSLVIDRLRRATDTSRQSPSHPDSALTPENKKGRP